MVPEFKYSAGSTVLQPRQRALYCVCYLQVRLTVQKRYMHDLGCIWKKNLKPDNVGSITSISSVTQDECCQYCLDSFNDTTAAFFQDSSCTCLKISHKTVPFSGSYYTYITRDPIRLNQSDYECGQRGSFNLLTQYFVVSEYEMFYVQFINMDLNLNLSTSVLMFKPDKTQINYDYVTVGFGIGATYHYSVNYFRNLTYTFLVGFVNETTQFAISHTRVANNPLRLIVYLKPFNVVANVKKSQAASWVYDSYAYNSLLTVDYIYVVVDKNLMY
ncbi:uncharacterized protein LOC136080391 [Hydra vulgaris]|uniref:Uncharacterized protein LOC136080391 n=1 Tax=Hydra vulgaris TaxID=6087 RepID=A0ABM4BV74_HYDVU